MKIMLMFMKHFKAFMLVSIFFYSFLGCKKDMGYKPPSDPAKAILGKWEIIDFGGPVKPDGYTEFLQDSIVIEHNYESQTYFYKYYWIDSLVHIGIKTPDNSPLLFEYKYIFYGDKMRLDIENFYMTYSTTIYKRIN